MASTYKVLGQSAPLATTETDLYTVPGATSAVCSSLVVCNRSAVAVTFRISVSLAGAATANKDYLFYDTALAANASTTVVLGVSMATTDKMRVYASTADLSFNLFGVELT